MNNSTDLETLTRLRDRMEDRSKDPTVQEMLQKAKRDAARSERLDFKETEVEIDRLFNDFKRIFAGTEPLLIPCERGTKQPTVKWGKLTHQNLDDAYAKRLRYSIACGGNIAVK